MSYKKSIYPSVLALIAVGCTGSVIIPDIVWVSLFDSIVSEIRKVTLTTLYIGCWIIAIIVLSGAMLNNIKIRDQKFYGIVEIIFSVLFSAFFALRIISTAVTISSSGINSIEWLTIILSVITACYFAQRGFGNYRDGKAKENK